jgi:hypothetical protein
MMTTRLSPPIISARNFAASSRYCIALAVILTLAPLALRAQDSPPAANNNPMTVQLVDSRRGYVARVPAEAILDSNSSGWSRKGHYEVRVYRMPGIGFFRFTVTVKPMDIPPDAINNGAYTYTKMDSATERGNAQIRTYYLPTRSVKIEIIPTSIRMIRYLEASEDIFNSFRWKPGATTDAIDTDPPQPHN